MTSKTLFGSKPTLYALSVLILSLGPIGSAVAQNQKAVPPSNDHSGRIPFACSDGPGITPTTAEELPAFTGVSAAEFLEKSVILGRPTDSSIGVSILPAASISNVKFSYRTESDEKYTLVNNIGAIEKCTPYEYDLQDLKPSTRYFYQISYVDANDAVQTTAEASFHTARGANESYTFAIHADPHVGSLYRFPERHEDLDQQSEAANEDMYAVTLANTANSGADFLIDLGDTFMSQKNFDRGLYQSQVDLYVQMKKENPSIPKTAARDLPVEQSEVRGDYVYLRSLIARSAHTVPMFFAVGNHEAEVKKYITPNRDDKSYSPALWGNNARHDFFSVPNTCENKDSSFYSTGSLEPDPGLGVCHESYYSFVWGDAMYIILDPMWEEAQVERGSPKQWAKSLGPTQYNWLHDTLEENADVPFKFVFMHNLVGGYLNTKGSERSGALLANYYEWGGCTEQLQNVDDPSKAKNLQKDIIHPEDYDIRTNVNGEDGPNCTYEFDKYRPDFAYGPIQNMLIEYGVQVVFHGHDHLYVSEAHPNGIVYQEVPKPSDLDDTLERAVGRAREYNYDTTNAVPDVPTKVDSNSGLVLVTVNAGLENGFQTAKVEYRKSVSDMTCLDGSEKCYTVDDEVNSTYTVTAKAPVAEPVTAK